MKSLIPLSSFLLFFMQVSAQDTIITTKGKVIPCMVSIMTPDYIIYADSTGTSTVPNSSLSEKIIHGHPFIATPQSELYNEINHAGYELERASNVFYSGFALMFIGAAASVTGILLNPQNNDVSVKEALYYSGAALGSVGVIVNFCAFINVRKAGNHLSKVKPNKQ